jgi:hypothetical protein
MIGGSDCQHAPTGGRGSNPRPNDDRVMHAVAARTDRAILPAAIAGILDRDVQRRARPRTGPAPAYCTNLARETAYQRVTATGQQGAQRHRSRDHDRDRSDGLEL